MSIFLYQAFRVFQDLSQTRRALLPGSRSFTLPSVPKEPVPAACTWLPVHLSKSHSLRAFAADSTLLRRLSYQIVAISIFSYIRLHANFFRAWEPVGLLVTAAVSPSNVVMDAAYDIPQLAKYLDYIR